uniref:PC315R n=1 Tax=African swine fever virus TaxID=10497 RepID=A0A6G7KU61_ASF
MPYYRKYKSYRSHPCRKKTMLYAISVLCKCKKFLSISFYAKSAVSCRTGLYLYILQNSRYILVYRSWVPILPITSAIWTRPTQVSIPPCNFITFYRSSNPYMLCTWMRGKNPFLFKYYRKLLILISRYNNIGSYAALQSFRFYPVFYVPFVYNYTLLVRWQTPRGLLNLLPKGSQGAWIFCARYLYTIQLLYTLFYTLYTALLLPPTTPYKLYKFTKNCRRKMFIFYKKLLRALYYTRMRRTSASILSGGPLCLPRCILFYAVLTTPYKLLRWCINVQYEKIQLHVLLQCMWITTPTLCLFMCSIIYTRQKNYF